MTTLPSLQCAVGVGSSRLHLQQSQAAICHSHTEQLGGCMWPQKGGALEGQPVKLKDCQVSLLRIHHGLGDHLAHILNATHQTRSETECACIEGQGEGVLTRSNSAKERSLKSSTQRPRLLC